MPNDAPRGQKRFPRETTACRMGWSAEAPDEALGILEHAEAIAMVEELRPYCTRWSVELQRPDIADEVGLVVGGPEVEPLWAIYRDVDRVLHFEDLVACASYTFGTMSAGLRFVRAVIEAAAAADAEMAGAGSLWDRLPAWLVADTPLRPEV